MAVPILQLNNINLSIEGFNLRDVSFDLYPGEVHIVMGENASGKSLLMQIIAGLVVPDSGQILFDGAPIRPAALAQKLQDDIIYVRQDAVMLSRLTVAENVFFYNLPYKSRLFRAIDFDKLNYQCQQLIDEFHLPVSVFDDVSTLGFAQRQILEFCRAYVSNARIAILDEPSSALTEQERVLLYDVVKRIKSRGTGIIYITHAIDDVFSLGDRLTVMKKGAVAGTKVVTNCTQEEIVQMLSGRLYRERYPKINSQPGKLLLSVRNLGYQDKLKNISFDLRCGEILGITGLAGSGRTLLANCLFGAIEGITGTVSLNGQNMHFKNPSEAISSGIAMVPENRLTDSIFARLDMTNNVAMSSLSRFVQYHAIDTNILEQVVADYIMKFNIPRSNHYSDSILAYSGGNQQKAIFAKWIMSRAKVYILDEPTRGLDAASKIDIYNSISDLVKKQAAIILFSSDIEEIMGISDRVAVLAGKSFACDVPASSITGERIMQLAVQSANTE